MTEQITTPPYDKWFSDVIALAEEKGLRPVYKGAWVDFFENGITPAQAIEINKEMLHSIQ